MDPFVTHVLRADSYFFNWKHLVVIYCTFQIVLFQVPVFVDAAIASIVINRALASEDYPYQQIPAPRPLVIASREYANDNNLEEKCAGCKLGRNGEMCSGSDQGECECTNCRCRSEWTGDTCQYLVSKITCEKMRNCILCQVYGAGPLAEGKDCRYFCNHNYPTPLIVKTLHFQDDEHLCSFIHHAEDMSSAIGSEPECRYFFKFGPILYDGSIDSSNLYIVAQQDMDCGKSIKFPPLRPISRNNDSFHIFAKSYDEVVRTSDEKDLGVDNKKKNNFFAVVMVFVFIALPFVTCAFSVIYNFSNLPCGLCNKFRQSSSKYLRNVRPFPGYLPNEDIGLSAHFRNDDRYSDSGRGTELPGS